jgi:Outer membrane protein beta-barrel domain
MKKTLFLLAVAVLLLQASGFSQKSRVGITAGITNSNMYGKVGGVTLNSESKMGITAGIFVEAPIGKSHFSFQPAINYVQKGRVLSETNAAKSWLGLRYADLDLNFVRNSKGKTTFFFGLGPSVGFALPSYTIIKTNNATPGNSNPDPEFTKSQTKINFGDELLDNFRGLDFGVNGLAGFRMMKGFQLSVNYNFGLRNIANKTTTDEIKNGYVGVRLGYLFSNK